MNRDKIKKFMREKGYICYTPMNASAGEWFNNNDVTLNMQLIESIIKKAQKELLDKILLFFLDKIETIQKVRCDNNLEQELEKVIYEVKEEFSK